MNYFGDGEGMQLPRLYNAPIIFHSCKVALTYIWFYRPCMLNTLVNDKVLHSIRIISVIRDNRIKKLRQVPCILYFERLSTNMDNREKTT